MAKKMKGCNGPYDPNMDNVIMKVLADGSVAYRLRKKNAEGREFSKVLHPEPGMSNQEIMNWLFEERKKFYGEVSMSHGTLSSKTPLADYFDEMFVRKKKLQVREKTLFDYVSLFNRHVREDLGKRPIGSITKMDLMEYYRHISENGVKEGSIQPIHRLVRAILSSALDDEIVSRNVAMGKGIAPRKKVPNGKALSKDDVLRFQDCIQQEEPFWRTLFSLMLHTRCRRSEIAGLRWEDVDLIEGTIHIRHSLVYTPKLGAILGDTKSEMSNRSIPLMHDDRMALYNMRQQCDRGFVFTFNPDPEGPIFPDSISRHLTALCDKYGLEHITPHMIRRTLPTILITKYKVDPKTLQCILGHSNISTTLGYYTMVDDAQRRETLEMYGDAIKHSDNKKAKKDSDAVTENLRSIPGSDDLSFVMSGKKGH